MLVRVRCVQIAPAAQQLVRYIVLTRNVHDTVIFLLDEGPEARERDPQLVEVDLLQYFREPAVVISE